MKQKTAMMELINTIKENKHLCDMVQVMILREEAQRLLKKEKEQIIKANRDGVDMAISDEFITGVQYYNETYKQD